MSVTAKAVLDVARGWIGYSEANGKFKEILNVYNSHTPLARNYKIQITDHWCDAFVSAVAIKAGAVDIIGTEVGCENHVQIFKNKGIWHEDGTIKPQVGDIVLFNWDDSNQPNDGYSDHIGFVEEVYGNTFACIEGNMSEAVGRRTINVGWGYIRGFARPKYGTSGSATATTTTVAKKTIEEIAIEVLQGAWGNGSARYRALTNAGYNYETVQDKVNELSKSNTTNSSAETITKIAKEVIAGKWGNDPIRKQSLTKAGYNYKAVQDKVNELLKNK